MVALPVGAAKRHICLHLRGCTLLTVEPFENPVDGPHATLAGHAHLEHHLHSVRRDATGSWRRMKEDRVCGNGSEANMFNLHCTVCNHERVPLSRI